MIHCRVISFELLYYRCISDRQNIIIISGYKYSYGISLLLDEGAKTEEDVILFYSRHCNGAVEWAKYLHKLYTELSKHKGRLR